jgi:hypothetical protein
MDTDSGRRTELDRRRREELRRSVRNPHHESHELAEQGFEEWTRGLPDEDTDALVDSSAGKPVRWVPGEGLLYPPLTPGERGLAGKSFALIDRLRSIDKRRIRRVFGDLAQDEITAVEEGLAAFLGLGGRLYEDASPASGQPHDKFDSASRGPYQEIQACSGGECAEIAVSCQERYPAIDTCLGNQGIAEARLAAFCQYLRS